MADALEFRRSYLTLLALLGEACDADVTREVREVREAGEAGERGEAPMSHPSGFIGNVMDGRRPLWPKAPEAPEAFGLWGLWGLWRLIAGATLAPDFGDSRGDLWWKLFVGRACHGFKGNFATLTQENASQWSLLRSEG